MQPKFLIQGHRGAAGLLPENTLPSFAAALDAGANSLETDVRLTADDVPVLIHDATMSGSGTPVHRMTAAELRGVPTLAELYRFIASRSDADHVIIDIDIKTAPFRPTHYSETIRLAVLDVIQKAGMVHQTWVRSFDHRIVWGMRATEPTLVGVVLIDGTAPVDPVALVRAADAQIYAPDFQFLNERQVGQCQNAGVRVMPWTVNEPADWERLIGWGVDGITTDYPDRLTAFLQGR